MSARSNRSSTPMKIDKRAEDMHDLSWTEGHINYYAFAEGMAFAAWLMRFHRSSNKSTEELYRLYARKDKQD